MNINKLMTMGRMADTLVGKMRKKFPSCRYTIFVTAWDDGTFKMECRHGRRVDDEHIVLSVYTYYAGEMTYTEDILKQKMGTS